MLAIFGPKKAPAIPANRIDEIAVGAYSGSTLSAAAKRYCCTKATLKPMLKQAKQYSQKLAISMAKAPTKAAQLAKIAALTKPKRRPFLLMIIDAGTVPLAVPTIIKATGRVANTGDGAKIEPTIPPRKIVTFVPVKAKTCARHNNQTLRVKF